MSSFVHFHEQRLRRQATRDSYTLSRSHACIPERRQRLSEWLLSLNEKDNSADYQDTSADSAGKPWFTQQLQAAMHQFLLLSPAVSSGAAPPPDAGGVSAHHEAALADEIIEVRARAEGLARMCAFSSKEAGLPVAHDVLEPLARKLGQLHSHVYVPRMSKERSLALLHALKAYVQVRCLISNGFKAQ